MKYLFAAIFLLACLSPGYSQTSFPRLKVQGNHLENEAGEPVTLKGVSLCSLEWHGPLQQIAQVTKPPLGWNVNVLRLPVQPEEWNRGGGDNYIKGYLDRGVAACTKAGVYCIIDWHRIERWNDPKIVAELEDFWKKVAPRYASNKSVIYEIFNEPTEPKDRTAENWHAWKAQAEKWIALIRKSAPDTLLLLGSPHWSQMPAFAAEDPVKDKNTAYVLHVYPNWKQDSWDSLFGDASDKIPLFITEWGWSSQEGSKGNVIHGSLKDYGTPLKNYLEARPQINWTAWSYDPHCGPAMLGNDRDMAKFVREWLAGDKSK